MVWTWTVWYGVLCGIVRHTHQHKDIVLLRLLKFYMDSPPWNVVQ